MKQDTICCCIILAYVKIMGVIFVKGGQPKKVPTPPPPHAEKALINNKKTPHMEKEHHIRRTRPPIWITSFFTRGGWGERLLLRPSADAHVYDSKLPKDIDNIR